MPPGYITGAIKFILKEVTMALRVFTSVGAAFAVGLLLVCLVAIPTMAQNAKGSADVCGAATNPGCRFRHRIRRSKARQSANALAATHRKLASPSPILSHPGCIGRMSRLS
jgi:hypothetical protein